MALAKTTKRLASALVALMMIGALFVVLRSQPVLVDTATVTRGLLQVTVDEDGKTRVKERFVVSAPLTGNLLRIELHAGDPVEAGKTQLAVIEPVDPQLLDARSKAEAEARVSAADANHQRADANLRRAKDARELAKHMLERVSKLIRSNAVSVEEFDRAEHADRQAAEELSAAEFAVKVAQFEQQLAQAAFIRTRTPSSSEQGPTALPIYSPIQGQVLRVIQESARQVSPGVELLEVGDLRNLEVEVDVLSADAVKIAPGADVWLEQWGGVQPLKGRVRRIEPSGFTKVSALGVEEQRVNVLVDLVDPLEKRQTLGDAFRVEARIVVWQKPDALKVPSGSLFRQAGKWSVFVVDQGKAALRNIEIEHNNGIEAEVVAGVTAGDTVILYPSDRINDQIKVAPRAIGDRGP